MKRRIPILVAVGTLFSAAHAAVINPTPGSLVDPAGVEEIDGIATNSATLAAFNAQSGLQVVQDWTGVSGNSNIINLTNLPDIRVTTSFNVISSGADVYNNDVYRTSASGIGNFGWSGANGQTLTIEFGTWNGSSFILDQAVASAGLAFVNFGGAYSGGQTVTYYNASATALSTQVVTGGTDSNSTGGDWFSGYISGSANISKITVAIARSTGSSNIAIDDLAFTVPEPATFALAAGLLVLGLSMWRRRRA